MNLHKLKIRSIFFLPLIVSLLAMVAVTGCSDEEDALQTGQYGYVQFKLYKSTGEGAATRATDKLELLSDAKKINVVMLRDGRVASSCDAADAWSCTAPYAFAGLPAPYEVRVRELLGGRSA